MLRLVFTFLALSITFALAQQVAPQVDSRYILGPLQAQRDRAANEAALCGAENTKLNEEMTASKAKIAELEKKLSDLEKKKPE
jgi:Skp family chaperone for outer membrane proteins